MKKFLQKFMFTFVFMSTAVCLLCTGCSRQPEEYRSTGTAMGTIISQTVYVSAGEEAARKITEEVTSCIDGLEQDCLSWRLEDSEIYRINLSAGSGQQEALSGFLEEVLEQCKKVYAASDGAFDFTIGNVARLWNIDSWAGMQFSGSAVTGGQQSAAAEKSGLEFTLPTQEQLAAVLSCVGADKCSIEAGFISLPEGMQLDLGAVGKGIALDEIRKLLAQHSEVTGAVISVGGSILTYGSKPDGSMWKVGIVDPFDTAQSLGTLSLPGGFCVSTSGDYERYVEVDGVRYHHILDPHTGMPADSDVKSVTIVCREDSQTAAGGLFSDALSTACFVLGMERGMELAEAFGAEVLFVDKEGVISMTEGMEQYFSASRQ